jgi:hypothetical protein
MTGHFVPESGHFHTNLPKSNRERLLKLFARLNVNSLPSTGTASQNAFIIDDFLRFLNGLECSKLLC